MLSLIYFQDTSKSYVTNGAGGLGMGVGKEKDWARKDKVVPCKSWKIIVVLTKKSLNWCRKSLNNINNCRNGVQVKVEEQAWSMDRI